jgi:hypothetical protein
VKSTAGSRVVIGVGSRLRVIYGNETLPLEHTIPIPLNEDTVVAVQISMQRGIVAVVAGVPQTLLVDISPTYDAIAQLDLDLALFQYGDSNGVIQNSSHGFVGRLYSLLVYDSLHDTTQMVRHSAALREEWGIPPATQAPPVVVVLPPACTGGLHVSASSGGVLYHGASLAAPGDTVTQWKDLENVTYLSVTGATYSAAGGGHTRHATVASAVGIYMTLTLAAATSRTACFAMRMTGATAGYPPPGDPLLVYFGHIGLAYQVASGQLGFNSWNGGFYGTQVSGTLFNKWVVVFGVWSSTSVGAFELAVWDSTGLLCQCPTPTAFTGVQPGLGSWDNIFTFAYPGQQQPIGAFGELYIYPGILVGSDRLALTNAMRQKWL